MLINKYLDASFYKKKFYLNNRGRGERDFTYIYDVVDIILKLRNKSIKKNEVFNICGNSTTKLQTILKNLAKGAPSINITERKANKLDVLKTHGNNSKLKKKIKNFKFTKANKSLLTTIKWYSNNHKLFK